MKQATTIFFVAIFGASIPVSLLAGSVTFQGGPTLGGAGNAALYDFQNAEVTDAHQVNTNFSLIAAAVNDNNTRISANEAGQTTDGSRLDTLEALAARVACSNVSFASERSYTTLGTQLDADFTGHGVCGVGNHVCNYQEATMYALIGNCAPAGSSWIVGGFSNTEFHRRSIWSGQHSTQCTVGTFPQWEAQWAGYDGRVHCNDEGVSLPVACCVDQ